MYTLLKIDLLDADPAADFFDEDRYSEVQSDPSLEKILALAVSRFAEHNKSFASWEDWTNRASDGAYEFEIISDEAELLFRASMMLRDQKVANALALAVKYHAGALRKGDGLEYITHILEITRLLDKNGFDADILAAGFCHDLLEDTDCTEEEIRSLCGEEVLRIVKAVSNDRNLDDKALWEKKKLKYILTVQQGGAKAIAVCIADKVVNLRSLLKEYKKSGDAIWERFNRGKEKKLWFEKKVLAMARKNWKHPMVKEYAALVCELEGRKGPRRKSKSKSIFDWEITYEGGKKEIFRGTADGSFEYALRNAETFSVEKVNDTPEVEETPAVRYRNLLLETIDYLYDMRQGVFGKALNLSMCGDLREIDEAFDEGDICNFNLEDLKAVNDINVARLVDLLEMIERTVDLTIDQNGLKVEGDLLGN